MRLDKRALRKSIIKEIYGTSMRFLLEAEGDPPADPAAAPPADPAAAPPVDPAAPAPAPDPMAGLGGPAPALDPAAPAPDPMAGLGGAPPAPPAPGAPPTPGAAAPTPVQGTKKVEADDPIEKFLVKAEDMALKKASNQVQVESLRKRKLSFLLEAEGTEPELDMDSFTADVARLIKNYMSLVDVKGNVITKAQKYLKEKYPTKGQKYSDDLVSLLGREYDIRLEPKEQPADSYATGAKSGGGAAG
jgi:hypothetical protein